jgi:hypothetical protein
VAIGLSLALVGGAVWWFATRDPDGPAPPSTAAAVPVAVAPAPAIPATIDAAPLPAVAHDDDRAHILAVLAAFGGWATAHPTSPCPTSRELAGAVAWAATIRITCDDQPGDQRIGVVAPGPDGALDTADDLHSWELARADLVAVRGARWHPIAKPRARTLPPPALHLDSNGIPDQR